MKTWNKPYFYHHDEEWNLISVSVGIDEIKHDIAEAAKSCQIQEALIGFAF